MDLVDNEEAFNEDNEEAVNDEASNDEDEEEKQPRGRKRPKRSILKSLAKKQKSLAKEPREPKEPKPRAKVRVKERKSSTNAKDIVNAGDNLEIFSFRGKNSRIRNGGIVT